MPDLSDNVNWSEVDANNNQAPPNGWPEGMMPSGVNDAARADRGAMKRFWDKINPVQTITPSSGGVWTFTTSNIAYPTAYVDGEIYCFRPGAPSAGGDQFQVNALAAKPIWKHATGGAGPIIAQDIAGGVAVQLVYSAALNAGGGAFVLLNPQVAISGDGSGGISGGMITATGLTVNGNSTVTGTLSSGPITTTGLTVNGALNAGAITGTGLTVNGASTLGGHLNITSGGAGITGDVSMGGALGVDGVLTAAGNRIVVEGSNAPSLTMYNTGDGTAEGMWGGGNNLNFGRMDGSGNPVTAWGYFASNGDLYLDYNLHVAGTLNGHPASVFDTLTTRLEELTSRVATLEAEVQNLRGHV